LQDLYDQIPTKSGFHELGKKFMIKMLYVMHAVVQLNRDKGRDPVEIINKAKRLDQELNDIKALLPPAWHPKRVRLDTPSDHYHGNMYSVCFHPVITQMWNYTRFLGIQVHDIIRTSLMRVCEEQVCEEHASPPFGTVNLKACIRQEEDMLRANVAAIIAAVPQTTGMIPSPTSYAAESISEGEGHVIREPGTFISSVVSPRLMQLIQPLYAVGTCPLISHGTRQWIIKILHFVALRIGSRQAVVLAAELQGLLSSAPNLANDWEDIAEWIALGSGVV
jgi:hypothetical protein